MSSRTKITQSGFIPQFEWMCADERDFRESAPDLIAKALASSELVIEGNLHIKYLTANSGQEAIAAELTIGEEGKRLFLKACRLPGVLASQSVFLKSWQSQGVRTPFISFVASPTIDVPLELIVMENITSPILKDVVFSTNEHRAKVYREMGRTLAKLHQVHGSNFGRPLCYAPTIGKCDNFEDEMSIAIDKKIGTLIESGIVSRNIKTHIANAIDIVASDLIEREPSLTHCDFKPDNIFLTREDEIIVIDPNCRITHPGMCLALSLIYAVCNSRVESLKDFDHILEGYSGLSNSLSLELLSACLLLRGIMSMLTWQRKNKLSQIKNLQCFYEENGIRY